MKIWGIYALERWVAKQICNQGFKPCFSVHMSSPMGFKPCSSVQVSCMSSPMRFKPCSSVHISSPMRFKPCPGVHMSSPILLQKRLQILKSNSNLTLLPDNISCIIKQTKRNCAKYFISFVHITGFYFNHIMGLHFNIVI